MIINLYILNCLYLVGYINKELHFYQTMMLSVYSNNYMVLSIQNKYTVFSVLLFIFAILVQQSNIIFMHFKI